MIFLKYPECEELLKGRNLELPDKQKELKSVQFNYPKDGSQFWPLAEVVGNLIIPGDEVLLWITEWGIWSSSENLHLYYRLRQSYHDFRLLHEAPGHLFLKHEMPDLSSFLQVAMLNGWGGYVIGRCGQANLFFSHDEYLIFYSDQQDVIDNFVAAVKGFGLIKE